MALDSREDFFGCKLTKDSKQFVWSVPDDSEADIEHKLQITQACLGIDAKQGERNVIDVTTTNEDDEEITHTILSLQLGLTDMTRCELGFLNKTTFKLVKGNGPVHLTGLHMQAAFQGTDSEEEDETSEDEEMAPKLVEVSKADQKAKPAADQKPAGKQDESKKGMSKAANETSGDKPKKESEKSKKEDAESSDESEDEEEEDQEAFKKAKDLIDDEAIEDDEDMDSEEEEEDDSDLEDEDLDDEDEDDDLDDEEDDDEDENEEDESDEEEEETKPPDTKKAKVMVNGHKNVKSKTPVKNTNEKMKEKQKTPQPEKKTPDTKHKTPKKDNKDAEKGSKTPSGTPNIEDIKKKLMKSPNLPKTAEKFKNFMKSAHKVVDDSAVKGLWDWVQKNKK